MRTDRIRGRGGRPRQRGFTLVELLVVAATIALLAALLLPVVSQVRRKSAQAVCFSNLKQLAAGMLLYSEEYDQSLPLALNRRPGEEALFPMTWMRRLQPYVKSQAAFIDPASGHRSPDWHTSSDLLANYGYPPSHLSAGCDWVVLTAEPFGVALWEGLGGFSGPPTGGYQQSAPSHRTSQVARPAETILLTDHYAFDWGVAAGHFYYPAPRHLTEDPLVLPDGTRIPSGWINAAFVDGHARALRQEQFWSILPRHTVRGGLTQDVFLYFWPDE